MSTLACRLGSPSDNWIYNPSSGYDLTRSLSPRLTLPTTTSQPITICPSTTALIVIDMQNFFLDPAAGRPRNPLAVEAERRLVEIGIPACREGGIRVVHLTWGIAGGAEGELASIPPCVVRGFGAVLEGDLEDVDGDVVVKETFGVRPTVGDDMGDVTLENGKMIPGGDLLMRDQWNTALHPPLEAAFQASQSLPLPDVRFHKARISGFSSTALPIVKFLRSEGIKTLLFTGVNTDQCVVASLQDAAAMGFDAVLMRDGCATASPDYARKAVEYNCRKNWGFVADLQGLRDGVRRMKDGCFTVS
ncbi:hypothetical protein NLU13_1178 [Sarocladium strictum]|uniref:Isochorismatase-like domain-containing protein n=1 Tax=Sarocladium strictum TaxID=5046 RepID=A0AA39GR77_SARSR|nr:hypothetical protein NLU13_1178 [Sarocladium strictum]